MKKLTFFYKIVLSFSLILVLMAVVGAVEHQALFDGFVTRYGIDLTDLSAFDVRGVRDYEAKTRMYPFDEYDDAFYDLEPLETYLKVYVRTHVQDF